MPRLEYLDLAHDPIGESNRGGEVWKTVECRDEFPSTVELPMACSTASDVSPEGGNAEAILAIEEQVYFVGS
jgi:hypothetical protein